MRLVVTAIVVMVLACATRLGAQTVQQEGSHTLTIRIYDYAGTRGELLGRAQEFVGDVYQSIGVSIRWVLSRPETDSGEALRIKSGELTVIIPRPKAYRGALPDNALGLAVVAQGETGRVAYVYSDRLSQAAESAGATVADVMGLVMAHEIGHLLLMAGAHTTAGLMQPSFSAHELRLASRHAGLTPMQADGIRRSVVGTRP